MQILVEILRFPLRFLEFFVIYFPGPIGDKLRYYYWKPQLKYLGRKVKIDVGVSFQGAKHISIGDRCWIDRNVLIMAGYDEYTSRVTYKKENSNFQFEIGEVVIGKETHIAPNVVLSGIGGLHIGDCCGIASNSTIYTFSHHYKNLKDRTDGLQYFFTPMTQAENQAMIAGAVVIQNYCSIGLNSTILPGVTIGEGTWIGSQCLILSLIHI